MYLLFICLSGIVAIIPIIYGVWILKLLSSINYYSEQSTELLFQLNKKMDKLYNQKSDYNNTTNTQQN